MLRQKLARNVLGLACTAVVKSRLRPLQEIAASIGSATGNPAQLRNSNRIVLDHTKHA
jgi:hypothetical protein